MKGRSQLDRASIWLVVIILAMFCVALIFAIDAIIQLWLMP